jgi:hypothetical protein
MDASASSAELTAIILSQPELKQIGRQVVVPGRITAPDRAAANVLTQLQPELRRMAPIRAS